MVAKKMKTMTPARSFRPMRLRPAMSAGGPRRYISVSDAEEDGEEDGKSASDTEVSKDWRPNPEDVSTNRFQCHIRY